MFQHLNQKRKLFQNLMHLFHLFCYWISHTCDHTCLYQTTNILFIKSITIIINLTILRFLLRVKKIHSNQPPSPLNHLSMCTCNHMAYFNIGNLFKRLKSNKRKKNLFCPQRLTMKSLYNNAINKINYLYLLYYYHIFQTDGTVS